MQCKMKLDKLSCCPVAVSYEIWDIIKIITPLGLNLYIYNLSQHYLNSSNNILKTFLNEVILIILPIILHLTFTHLWSNHVIVIYILVSLFAIIYRLKANLRWKFTSTELNLTICRARSFVFIITAVAILAVDFPQYFPHSMTKSDYTGISLMDTGIGYFIFCIGIVSKHENLQKCMKKSILLIVMGAARTLLIILFKYHQSELEYGTHWNAFFTIGFTQLFGNLIIHSLKHKKIIAGFGIFLVLFHEIVLQKFLFAYVMNGDNPRDNFISANREGLVSTIGFLAFYLICNSFSFTKQNIKSIFHYICKTFCISFTSLIILLILLFYSNCNIARRVANLEYILFMIFLSFFTLFLMLVAEFLSSGLNVKYENQIFVVINFNGLIFFLITNVLTGVANMSFDLKKFTFLEMIILLCSYMVLSYLITYLWKRYFYTKLVTKKNV
ncbi:uncharacterized protein LOC129612753 [Condylostylus longicornis]|uniref:uncharacterized protein LOC129612753 n=1 Tax=Condylostylus longicornis TaxID=2530218 RepID=UPI00244E0F17|nr:uncharacterized protein LOC129612753 [Condylostylus longicornis]